MVIVIVSNAYKALHSNILNISIVKLSSFANDFHNIISMIKIFKIRFNKSQRAQQSVNGRF